VSAQATLFDVPGETTTTEEPPEVIEKSAWVSEDEAYRYDLTRHWGWTRGRTLTFVMLNPSTADADVDDRTIGRCMGFGRTLGFDGIRVVNLYAHRATKPKAMFDACARGVDIVGPDNARALRAAFEDAARADTAVIAAWGAHARPDRVAEVCALADEVGIGFGCLAYSKTRAPKHPLYLPGDSFPIRWVP
jgi:hypothetical protein